jgi:hypothetical protein
MTPNEATTLRIVRALMADDPATFKAGYSLDNALLAVQDVYGVSAATAARIRAIVEAAR